MSSTLSQIAERLGLAFEGPDVPIRKPSLVEDAGSGTLTLATSAAYVSKARERGASAVLTGPGIETDMPCLRAERPRLAFARLLAMFDDRPVPAPGIHPTAVVAPDARVDAMASVGPHAVVESGVVIGPRTVLGAGCVLGSEVNVGAGSVLGPHVVVHHRCVLGDRVRVQTGSVIGSDGYGYEWDGTEHVPVPHIGRVVVEDDVEIGANCGIDRAKTGETRIGRGTKIDNLVHIGHGVRIGPHCIIVGQVGIAGSAVLEAGVMLAGQAGVADNVTIGAGTIVSAQTGVTSDLPASKVYMGFPAREAGEYRRIHAAQSLLPDLVRRVRALERKREP